MREVESFGRESMGSVEGGEKNPREMGVVSPSYLVFLLSETNALVGKSITLLDNVKNPP